MAKKEVKKGASINFQPLGDRVLLKPIEAEHQKTASGIIIPDTASKEKPEQGKVVAVGAGKRGDDNELIPVAVKVGDTVIFSKYGFDEVKINDEEYYIVGESNILGIIKK